LFGGLFRPLHLLLIFIVVLILFGPGNLPRIGKVIGKGLRELKRIMSSDNRDRMRSGADWTKTVVKSVLKLYYIVISKK
jgi:sec-independent protein translocase protein TatA